MIRKLTLIMIILHAMSCRTPAPATDASKQNWLFVVRTYDNYANIQRVLDICELYNLSRHETADDSSMPGMVLIMAHFEAMTIRQKRELQTRLENLGGAVAVKSEIEKPQ